jgi:hypothetical protein
MIKKWASILNHGLDLDSDGPRDMIMMPTMKVSGGCKPSAGVLAPHQSFPYPTWVPTAIKDGKDHNHIVDDAVIHGKREPFGELAVVSENNLVNTSEVCQ